MSDCDIWQNYDSLCQIEPKVDVWPLMDCGVWSMSDKHSIVLQGSCVDAELRTIWHEFDV